MAFFFFFYGRRAIGRFFFGGWGWGFFCLLNDIVLKDKEVVPRVFFDISIYLPLYLPSSVRLPPHNRCFSIFLFILVMIGSCSTFLSSRRFKCNVCYVVMRRQRA